MSINEPQDSHLDALKKALADLSEDTTTRSKEQGYNKYRVSPNPLHRLLVPVLREEIPDEEQHTGHAYISPSGEWKGYGKRPRSFSDLSWYIAERYEPEEFGNKSPRYSDHHTFYSFIQQLFPDLFEKLLDEEYFIDWLSSREPGWLTIVGDLGSGKTSFVLATLSPIWKSRHPRSPVHAYFINLNSAKIPPDLSLDVFQTSLVHEIRDQVARRLYDPSNPTLADNLFEYLYKSDALFNRALREQVATQPIEERIATAWASMDQTDRLLAELRYLNHTSGQEKQVVIIDNLDRYKVNQQVRAIILAQTIRNESDTSVVVVARTSTYLQARLRSVFRGGMVSPTVVLTPPKISRVLNMSIERVLKKTEDIIDEKAEKISDEEFQSLVNTLKESKIPLDLDPTGSSVSLVVPSVKKAIESIVASSITGDVEDFLFHITNVNLRISLLKVKEYLTSGFLNWPLVLYRITDEKYPMVLPFHFFLRSYICRNNRMYQTRDRDPLSICNVFTNPGHSYKCKTIVRLKILDYLSGPGHTISVDDLKTWPDQFAPLKQHIEDAIRELIEKDLILSSVGAQTRDLAFQQPDDEVIIRQGGKYFLEHVIGTLEYLTSVKYDVEIPRNLATMWDPSQEESSIGLRALNAVAFLSHLRRIEMVLRDELLGTQELPDLIKAILKQETMPYIAAKLSNDLRVITERIRDISVRDSRWKPELYGLRLASNWLQELKSGFPPVADSA